jgi:type I restriction enzyme S subunit
VSAPGHPATHGPGTNGGEPRVGLRGFRPYPTYKDSGVDWLGAIPEDWEAKRLKVVAPTRVAKVDTKPEELPYVGLENVESWTGRLLLEKQPTSVDSVVGSFMAGDVLFGKLRPYLAKAARPDFMGVCTGEILPLQPRDGCFQGYLMYCLLNKGFIQWLDSLTYGTKMPRVGPEQVAASFVPVPSHSEQHAIARFLDRETTRIDSLIAKKEQLIGLLQEERSALITQAVTKGLDSGVSQKDSGVEWLGKIPAHWDVKRTKFLARLRTGHTPSRQHPEYWQNCSIPWFGLADVWQIRDGRIEYVSETSEKISELGLANSSARLLPRGTVIVSRTASVGFSAIMGVDMATTQDFVNWICGPTLRPEYLLYVFRSMSSEFQRLTMGSTHQTIYMPDVGRFSTPHPPVSEQNRIIAFVRAEASRIDTLAAKVQDAIEQLKELRTALISAAVTGKIDVRNEAA